MWEYVKGSEQDFEGAPEWATKAIWTDKGGDSFVYWLDEQTKKIQSPFFAQTEFEGVYGWCNYVKAERRKVDNLQSRVNDEKLSHSAGYVTWDEFNQTETKKILAEFDTVQHPAHYNQSGIECIDAIAAAVKGKSGIEAVCVANVIKYLWRYEIKDGVESVRKAQWYLDRLVKELSK